MSNLQLLAALLLRALALALGIDLGSEWARRDMTISVDSRGCVYGEAWENSLLPLKGEPVQHKDKSGQEDARNLAVV